MGNCQGRAGAGKGKAQKEEDKHEAYKKADEIIVSEKTGGVEAVKQVEDELVEGGEEDIMEDIEYAFERYAFPFENIVFEGGGNKVLAYCGAVRVLEEIGTWQRVKRLAGVSSGSMVASLLSVGYNSKQLEEFFTQDIRQMFLDTNGCGYSSLLPNLLRIYGWNPGQKILTWFGSKLKEATGNADITFMEIYQRFGIELCVVVINLNHTSVEYCHTKTTPDMPVRVAVRMSLSMPGMFKPVVYQWNDNDDIFVDGGILCNYPVNAFDGWWLSMDWDNAFVKKLEPLENLPMKKDQDDRFESFNERTLGLVAYSKEEKASYLTLLEGKKKEEEREENKPPNTKLHREHVERSVNKVKVDKYAELADAVDKFLQTLKSYSLDKSKTVTKNDLKNALAKVRCCAEGTDLTDEDLKLLFGEKTTAEDIFVHVDSQHTDQITYPELVGYLESKGLPLQSKYLDQKRREIRSLVDYVLAVHETISLNTQKASQQKRDAERTIGIETLYISATNFELEEEDKNYLLEQGRRAVCDFLYNYVCKKYPALKDEGKAFDRAELSRFIDDDVSQIIDMRDYNEDYLRGVL